MSSQWYKAIVLSRRMALLASVALGALKLSFGESLDGYIGYIDKQEGKWANAVAD